MGIISWFLNSWISIWLTMEVSVLFLIGILRLSYNYDGTSLIIKYYLIQLIISLIFIIVTLFYIFNFFIKAELRCLVILLAKLGVFPFHYWIIIIIGKIDWRGFFILNTIFKLPPLRLVYFMVEISIFRTIVVSSVFIGSCLGLNNVVIQKLLGYSSLIHLCWLLLRLRISIQLYFLYFISYSLTLILLIFLLKSSNSFYINQFKLSLSRTFYNFVILASFLRLSGFPPFIGFVIKWIVIRFIVYRNIKFIIFLIVVISIWSVMFYFQIFYYFLLVFSLHFKWYSSLILNKLLFISRFIILVVYFGIYLCV